MRQNDKVIKRKVTKAQLFYYSYEQIHGSITHMKINANFSEVAMVKTAEQEWQPSPIKGVERKPLDRVGEELARATSMVRYAPNSAFSPHVHNGGEEFIVLEGVFQDEYGDYPSGSYVRNPPQSKHTPRSEQGCTIFVKLWQFQPDDRKDVNVIMQQVPAVPSQKQSGVVERELFTDNIEQVKHLTLAANTPWLGTSENGYEVLILNGSIKYGEQTLQKHDWLRVPIGTLLQFNSENEGACVWLKSGNLSEVEQQIALLLKMQ